MVLPHGFQSLDKPKHPPGHLPPLLQRPPPPPWHGVGQGVGPFVGVVGVVHRGARTGTPPGEIGRNSIMVD